MVDETDRSLAAIYGDATYHVVAILPRSHILQAVAIHNLEILYLQTLYGIDVAHHLIVSFLHGMILGKLYTRLQSLVDIRCDGTLISREQCVTATLSQTILITDDRTLHNLHIAVDILHELLDDSNLLPILLTEISTGRTNDKEQATYHLAYTIEVTRTLGTLHHGTYRRELEVAGIRCRIHLLYRRSKHIVSTTSLEELAVSIECTWITLQVTLVIKLSRIQENGNYRNTVFLNTALNQRGMTLMKRAHSWHEADFLSLLATIEKFVLEVNNLIDYFHLLICFRVQNNNFFLK